jgi:hypothetical protein
MTWNDVTVYQYQQIQNIKEEDIFDADIKLVSIMYNITEKQVDALSMAEFNEKKKEISFVHGEPLVPKTNKYLKVKKKVYRFVPDIRQIKVGATGRYITTKYFQKNVVENLHKIAASMIIPQKKGWFGLKDDTYDALKHEEYADDMLHAKITEVYGMIVFFCKVYLNWIDNSKDYLIQTMMMVGKTNHLESEKLVSNLWTYMDGYIKQPLLPNTKE